MLSVNSVLVGEFLVSGAKVDVVAEQSNAVQCPA